MCCSVGVVTISMDKGNSAKVDVLVVHGKPLGIDAIKALGGIIFGANGISEDQQ